MKQKRLKLAKFAKANFVIGYISISLAIILVCAFIVSLFLGKNPALAVFLLVYVGIIIGGIDIALIITSVILSGFEVKMAKEIGTFGGISPNGVIAVMVISDILALIGILVAIVYEAIITWKGDAITTINSASPGEENMVSYFTCVSFVGCLVQAIFNTVYYVRLKESL